VPAPYKILTLGDSVMWGQGLAQQHKFVQLVADHIADSGKEVELAPLAHSGAVVCLAPTPPAPHQDFLFGELPRSFPSIASQLATAAQAAGYEALLQPNGWDPAAWKAQKQALRQQIAGFWQAGGAPPDLILMDGGINDLGALQIVIPWFLGSSDPCAGPAADVAPAGGVAHVLGAITASGGDLTAFDPGALEWMTPEELKALVDRYVYDRMRQQVGRVAQTFTRSQVVVTGYFPIFTQGSAAALASEGMSRAAPVLFAAGANHRELVAALGWALHPALDRETVANRIIEQSALWYSYSTARLQAVVDEANQLYGQRFALAAPLFGPDSGALAPDSLLWSFTSLVDEVIRQILRLFGLGEAAWVGELSVPPHALEAASLPGLGLGAPGDWVNALAFAAGLAIGAAIATDEVSATRVSAAKDYYLFSPTGRADPETNAFTGLKAGFASAGHPNVRGAQAYFAAIESVLP
jgi:hypothetical protein